jgi:hypothetical protein
MAWSGLLVNQMVSEIDAQTSGFTLNSGQSHGTTNLCLTKAAAFLKYNLSATANTNALATNQLIRKDFWISGGFSAYMTVGANAHYGYRLGLYGSMTDTNIANPAGQNAILQDLYWATGTLAFGIVNGSTTIAPNGWTILNIGGLSYSRTSFSYSYNGPTNKWLYTLSALTNPFGTVVGATRSITLT